MTAALDSYEVRRRASDRSFGVFDNFSLPPGFTDDRHYDAAEARARAAALNSARITADKLSRAG